MRLRHLLAPALALLTAGTLLAPPLAAQARPQDGNLTGSGYLVTMPRTGSGWTGAYHVGGTTAWCIDLASDHPSNASAWTATSVGPGLRKQVGWGSGNWVPHGSGGGFITRTEWAQLGWLTFDAGSRPSPDVAAAVDHAVRLRTIDGDQQRARERARWAAVTAAHPRAAVEFRRLSEEAVAFAGPYTPVLEWVTRPTTTQPTGELRVGVRAASGRLVPNRPVQLAASGAMRLANPPSTTGGTGEARVTVTMPPPDDTATSGSIAAVVDRLPGTELDVFIPKERTVQRLITAPKPVSVRQSLALSLQPQEYHPEVTTRTADVIALAGAPAVDIITVTGGKPGKAFSGTSALYGPFRSLAELTAAGPTPDRLVGTAKFSGTYGPDGSAEVRTHAGPTFPAQGYYTWVEKLSPAPHVTPPKPAAWPQLPETSVVLAPTVTTQLSTWTSGPSTQAGTEVSDTLSVAGLPGQDVPGSDTPLTVVASGVLAGPVAPRDDDGFPTCEGVDFADAPVVSRYSDVTVGPDPVPGLARATLTDPGCYSAAATVVIRHGDVVVTTLEHPFGVPEQGVLVVATPTPTPSPSVTPTPSPSITPSASVTPSPSVAPSPSPTRSTPPATAKPSSTPQSSTPRIDSGAPLRETQYGMALLGLVVVGLSVTIAGLRSRP